MRKQAAFRSDSFWADLGNWLVFARPYRTVPKSSAERFKAMYGVHKCPLCGTEHCPPDAAPSRGTRNIARAPLPGHRHP